jgi:hypothetical protein
MTYIVLYIDEVRNIMTGHVYVWTCTIPIRYSFGLVLWEIYTGGKAFANVPNMLLGHQIIHDGRRPVFPPNAPIEYVDLALKCWDADPAKRCDVGG